jgi:methylenetetrahydrofolate--tRNA-(uracil-5-)-methyltransferase
MKVRIIGGGLAGVEATWYLAKLGYEIDLYEMRPNKMTEAHKTNKLAEIICSNSLKSDAMDNASGILKYEMETFGSLVMESARLNRVEAGGALAVDREGFSEYITKYTNDNKCKLLNPVSHIKLDGDDVVIYQKGCYDKYTSGYGDITINREIARIPKCEIIALLQELKNQTVED